MPSQFNEKLQPFADWIKAGNVQQQATESGLQFQIDVTQRGYNTGQLQLNYAVTPVTPLQIAPGQDTAVSAVTPVYRKPFYLKHIVLQVDSIVLLTPINVCVTVSGDLYPPYSIDASGTPNTAIVYQPLQQIVLQNYVRADRIYIPIDRHLLQPLQQFTIEINLSRVLAVGEQFDILDVQISGNTVITGLEIVHP